MRWGGSQYGWILDHDISVKVVLHDRPRIDRWQAVELEDELIAEYHTEEFQRKLHRAWDAAGGDPVLQKEARTCLCLPIQIEVLRKYGFEPSLKGVRESVREF